MKYTIHFQYKGKDDERPDDYALNDEEILEEEGRTIPIPNVGDSVLINSGGEPKIFKVLTKLFSYHPNNNFCGINIVVTDISDKERKALIKE